MVVIIENLSEIAAGSLMVGTPINLVQRPISPGLITDVLIKQLCLKTSEMVKGYKRKVELLEIEPRVIGSMCQCSATTAPTRNYIPLIPALM